MFSDYLKELSPQAGHTKVASSEPEGVVDRFLMAKEAGTIRDLDARTGKPVMGPDKVLKNWKPGDKGYTKADYRDATPEEAAPCRAHHRTG